MKLDEKMKTMTEMMRAHTGFESATRYVCKSEWAYELSFIFDGERAEETRPSSAAHSCFTCPRPTLVVEWWSLTFSFTQVARASALGRRVKRGTKCTPSILMRLQTVGFKRTMSMGVRACTIGGDSNETLSLE